MSALITLVGPAAALLRADINTDTIAPLVRAPGGGPQPAGIRSEAELASRLFGPWRYHPDGSEDPGFVLNRPPFRQARFLLAGANFACGSSRETAATMLGAFGIRCIIAPGFGLIFHDNCFRNHMLPLTLDWQQVQALAERAVTGVDFRLDLQACTLTAGDEPPIVFSLPDFRRDLLLQGADEISLTLGRADAITRYQASVREHRPWELREPTGAVSRASASQASKAPR